MSALVVFGVGLLLLVALVDWRGDRGRDCPCDHAGCEGRCRS